MRGMIKEQIIYRKIVAAAATGAVSTKEDDEEEKVPNVRIFEPKNVAYESC